ncbi:19309_t:CDS:2 [Racocetra persica]|uniref:19309_t:CDS:1 n=1 Tax=Racocetra persica TaxID=160502 RepID=A0ACA9N0L8_9GLOM|nr:19309_t:CDS:2 [Racocetra persica]
MSRKKIKIPKKMKVVLEEIQALLAETSEEEINEQAKRSQELEKEEKRYIIEDIRKDLCRKSEQAIQDLKVERPKEGPRYFEEKKAYRRICIEKLIRKSSQEVEKYHGTARQEEKTNEKNIRSFLRAGSSIGKDKLIWRTGSLIGKDRLN